MLQISPTSTYDGQLTTLTIDKKPDKCPVCHVAVEPVHYSAYLDNSKSRAQVTFRCTNLDCQNLFIGTYKKTTPTGNTYFFHNAAPKTKKATKTFNGIIAGISPSFIEIYKQSDIAEQDGLLEICGVGYRKSLEFLIKDYLISLTPEKAEEIKDKFLGKCISENIENANIKTVAKRATWLGNDETHYVRKWETKDVTDLKDLIELTVHWIEMEEKTKHLMKEMPE